MEHYDESAVKFFFAKLIFINCSKLVVCKDVFLKIQNLIYYKRLIIRLIYGFNWKY